MRVFAHAAVEVERVMYAPWSSVFTQITSQLFLSKAVKLLQAASCYILKHQFISCEEINCL